MGFLENSKHVFQLASNTVKSIQETMNSFGKLKVLDTGTREYLSPEHYREKHLKLQVRMFLVWTHVPLKNSSAWWWWCLILQSSSVLWCDHSSNRPSFLKYDFLFSININIWVTKNSLAECNNWCVRNTQRYWNSIE